MRTYLGRHRVGFTLVELLVVIAIIGVLVGLLLPAVQAAREAARRMSCSNNMKNMALAVHNYHDTHKKFPAGNIAWNGLGTNSTRAQANSEPNGRWYNGMWAWPVAILPFMEGQNLYDQMDFNQLPYTPERGDVYFGDYGPETNHGVVNELPCTSAPAAFRCPSVPLIGDEGAFKDYAGNSGGTRMSTCCPERATDTDGIFHKNKNYTFGSIIDGSSNTLLFVEQSNFIQGHNRPTNPFVWMNHSSQGESISHQGGNSFPPNLPKAIVIDAWRVTGRLARGMHPSGIMVAYCDGSVGFVSETISVNNWRAIHSRDAGEVVQN
ncbi:hypothetical protein FF011L_36980 [Roseimaritima multifibrata]|uniref:DUF1559 domain-containing protein n=1 Tax=Roseimaritima multifibrata TaxID=1930274 RepID=A0A517MJ41_9BACT|nr:DUF1559 domain-containing protein [Roseimaritima multifibrata]QDS94915.1 hypothetical protein FF011L_36980 [Roseimaritima multifibrata]